MARVRYFIKLNKKPTKLCIFEIGSATGSGQEVNRKWLFSAGTGRQVIIKSHQGSMQKGGPMNRK